MEDILDTIKYLADMDIDDIIEYIKLENVDILSIIKYAKQKEENTVLIPLLLKASIKDRQNNAEITQIKNIHITTTVYVISDPLNESVDRYKIGSHTGTINKLVSRYITSLPELKIYYFEKTPLPLDIEAYFKRTSGPKRIININNNKSEWYIMPLQDIISTLNSLLNHKSI